jgi:hypothetical protein
MTERPDFDAPPPLPARAAERTPSARAVELRRRLKAQARESASAIEGLLFLLNRNGRLSVADNCPLCEGGVPVRSCPRCARLSAALGHLEVLRGSL